MRLGNLILARQVVEQVGVLLECKRERFWKVVGEAIILRRAKASRWIGRMAAGERGRDSLLFLL